ncbi:MAG TPA: c-type cytochrome [Burkholderiales bacterium]|nr:c-type cytochrome [Burkholderiales bacterium]
MKRTTVLHLIIAAAAFGMTAPAFADAALAAKYSCTACHSPDKKMLGPAYKDVAAKYQNDAEAPARLAGKVKQGSSGVWGPVPMPPNAGVPDDDVKKLVAWVLAGAK